MKYAVVIVWLLICAFAVKPAHATNIRGQVVRYSNGRYIPMSGVRVDLIIKQGQSWVDVRSVTTGSDGFYFFNIPPSTVFYIKVANRYFPPQRPIVALNVPNYQDVAAVVI